MFDDRPTEKMQDFIIGLHAYLIVALFFIGIYQILFDKDDIILYIDVALSIAFILISITVHNIMVKYYNLIQSNPDMFINDINFSKKIIDKYSYIKTAHVLFLLVLILIFGLFILTLGSTYNSYSLGLFGLYFIFYALLFCKKAIVYSKTKNIPNEE